MRYVFSNFVLDTDAHSLSLDGEAQPVEPQVFDLLHLLMENAGDLVTKDQLIDKIWGGRIVSESAVSARVAAARKAVGDNGKRQAIIRTVVRRGLQFVAPVKVTITETAPPEITPDDNVGLRIRYATANDGAKLAYSVHGTGTPLLRVSAGPSHLELDWNEPTERAFIDALAQHCMLVRFDQRGIGLSDPDMSIWDIDQLADDIGSVADALKLDRFALMGGSGDAQTAVYYAAKYPERVSKLIVKSGYVDGRMVRDNTQPAGAQDPFIGFTREGWDLESPAFVAAIISIYNPDAPTETIQNMAANRKASVTSSVEELYRNGLNHSSIAEYLANVRAPTLIFHSKNSAVHPLSEARKMAGGIPGAELVVLDSRNDKTFPQEDAWDHHLSALVEFLNRAD